MTSEPAPKSPKGDETAAEETGEAQQAVAAAGQESEEGTPAGTPAPPRSEKSWTEFWEDPSDAIATLVAGLFLCVVVGLILYGLFRLVKPGTAPLDIVAGIQPAGSDKQSVVGRVRYSGMPEAGVTVFAEMTVGQNNVWSPPAQTTDQHGAFTISDIPDCKTPPPPVRIFASKAGGWFTRNKMGEYVVVRADSDNDEQIATPQKTQGKTLGYLAVGWFIASLLVALMFFPQRPTALKIKYGLAVVMALGFPIIVILTYGYGQSTLVEAAASQKPVLMGVANIFPGTYVEGQPEELLFSFTQPPPKAPSTPVKTGTRADTQEKGGTQTSTVVKGFGAPMWVLFLSVIGASLFTIAIIVKEIEDPPGIDGQDIDLKELRKRIQLFVQHEFYIVFAPLGGIFVYQLLVMSGTANHPVTVGLVALGAGVTSNALLARAVKLSESLVESAGKPDPSSSKATVAAKKPAENGPSVTDTPDAAKTPALMPAETAPVEKATSAESAGETTVTTKKIKKKKDQAAGSKP